jgi:hypothetical protein
MQYPGDPFRTTSNRPGVEGGPARGQSFFQRRCSHLSHAFAAERDAQTSALPEAEIQIDTLEQSMIADAPAKGVVGYFKLGHVGVSGKKP